MSKIKKIYAVILIVALVVSLTLIFSNSMKSKSVSANQSNDALGVIDKVIQNKVESNPSVEVEKTLQIKFLEYIKTNIRKVAHFVEFFILGIEVSLLVYTVLYKKGIQVLLNMVYFAMTVSLIDETIQIFSNRGPLVQDIILDTLSAVFAMAIVLLIKVIIEKQRKKSAK